MPDGYWFAHDPLLHSALEQGGSGNWVAIAGTVVDLTNGEVDLAAVARRLQAALELSETAFHLALDDIAGRFVAIYGRGGSVRVLNDAGGLKTVFYTDGPSAAAASHTGLLVPYTGDRPSEPALAQQRDPGLKYWYGYPGNLTPYAGLRMLTPNTLLDLRSGHVERYFPREPLQETDRVEDVAAEVTRLMRLQAAALLRRGPVVASLSAGLDTRTTLAALRPFIAQLEFFTYRRPRSPSLAMDAATAGHISAQLGLRHSLIDVSREIDRQRDYQTFARGLARNAHLESGFAPRIAYQYWEAYGRLGVTHVRSNMAEIGRAFYRNHTQASGLQDGREMAELFGRGMRSSMLESAFDEFAERSQFTERYNYDPLDLFYWEHRMGTWNSRVAMESDPAFETHVLFNSRSVLMAMLSLPAQLRLEGRLFHHIIGGWPELAAIPINPEDWRERFGEPATG